MLVDDADRQALSDFTCTALQLANFWQDVSDDYHKGRIYLPLEDLRRHQVAKGDIAAADQTLRFPAMNRRRSAGLKQRRRCVAGISLGFGSVVARADGAACEECRGAREQGGADAVHLAANSLRFHQPPPSAWNNAMVSP